VSPGWEGQLLLVLKNTDLPGEKSEQQWGSVGLALQAKGFTSSPHWGRSLFDREQDALTIFARDGNFVKRTVQVEE
jgi:hypothetical protein